MNSYRLKLACILLVYSLDSFGIAIAYPVFTPIFFNPDAGFITGDASLFYRALSMGLFLSLFPISQFFAVPFIGDFSDRLGRKRIFTFTLLGSSICYLAGALAIYYHNLLLLYFCRLGSGFFAGNTSLCFAGLADISSTDAERSKNFGLMAAAGGISFFISILSGEYFFNRFESLTILHTFPFLIIAIFSIIAWILIFLFYEDSPSLGSKQKFHISQGYHHIVASLKNNTLRNSYLVYFYFAIGWIAIMQFYPSVLLETYQKPAFSSTLNLIAVGCIWSFTNFFIQKFLAKKFTPNQILWVSLPLLFLLLISCLPFQTYISFSVHFSVCVFFAALAWTNTFANVSLNAPKEIQGRIMGINQSFSSLATITASLLGGLFAAINPLFVFILSGLCTFLSFYFLKKQKK